MRSISLLSWIPLLAVLPSSVQAAYSLQELWAGDDFFDGWRFWGNRDNLTNGATYYVAADEAQDVAYTNADGNVVIKVDNTSQLAPNGLRNSVRITTERAFDIGHLFVMDALHLPYGCSVWPAFWTHAVSWPSGGECDIVEGVNLQEANGVALHSVAGCFAADGTGVPTGELTATNCDHTVNANQGCTFEDTRNASYGAEFAEGGGGVYAMELSSEAISVWFFPRNEVPADLRDSSTSPDPTTWGRPVAYYASSGCNINQFFAPQQITINIALCGDWAGQPGVFSPVCGTGTCAEYVADPSHFDTAYFEIASVRVYGGGLNTRYTNGTLAAASGIIGAIGGGDAGAMATGVSSAGRLVAPGAEGGVRAGLGAVATVLIAGLSAVLYLSH